MTYNYNTTWFADYRQTNDAFFHLRVFFMGEANSEWILQKLTFKFKKEQNK